LAFRFTLSQKAVVAGIPPAWLDLAAKAWEAGQQYRAVSENDIAQLRKMADQALPVFKQGEEVAHHKAWQRHHPIGPHEGCPGMFA
jgi:hypothetical protein